jgi:hypothetical protein
MALTSEDVRVIEAPSEAPPEQPNRSRRGIIGWVAVGVAVAATGALMFAVLSGDDDATSTPAWTGDAKDHPGYGPVDPAQLPWTGDAKDHPGYGPVDPAQLPWTGDAKDHPGYGPVDVP